jgi:hypothetical protein
MLMRHYMLFSEVTFCYSARQASRTYGFSFQRYFSAVSPPRMHLAAAR